MGAYYFDSSALVKYYAQETGTNWVRGLIDAQPTNEIFSALVTGAEIAAAIKRRERRSLIAAPTLQRRSLPSEASLGFASKHYAPAMPSWVMRWIWPKSTNCAATMRFNWQAIC